MRIRNMREIQQMMMPVECAHCGSIYDLVGTELISRHADCSVFKSPCCNRTVDDRPVGWKSRADFKRLNKEDLRQHRARLIDLGGGQIGYMDMYGNVRVSKGI